MNARDRLLARWRFYLTYFIVLTAAIFAVQELIPPHKSFGYNLGKSLFVSLAYLILRIVIDTRSAREQKTNSDSGST